MVSKVPVKQLGTFTANILSGETCDSSVYVGAIVRVNNLGVFVNAMADTPINAMAFGICVAKTATTIADILLPGGITGNIYAGLFLETNYFLSPTVGGAITTVLPTGSGQIILNIGKPYTSNRLLFNPLQPIRRAL